MSKYLTPNVADNSKIMSNGLLKWQVIYLWTGKQAMESPHYTAPFDGPIEDHPLVVDIIRSMQGIVSDRDEDPQAIVFYGSLAGFEARTPYGTYRYLRPHVAAELERENARRTAGPPLQGQRIDWKSADIDWSKGNAELGRELGVSRQTVSTQRKRCAQKNEN